MAKILLQEDINSYFHGVPSAWANNKTCVNGDMLDLWATEIASASTDLTATLTGYTSTGDGQYKLITTYPSIKYSLSTPRYFAAYYAATYSQEVSRNVITYIPVLTLLNETGSVITTPKTIGAYYYPSIKLPKNDIETYLGAAFAYDVSDFVNTFSWTTAMTTPNLYVTFLEYMDTNAVGDHSGYAKNSTPVRFKFGDAQNMSQPSTTQYIYAYHVRYDQFTYWNGGDIVSGNVPVRAHISPA